ncbi:MAG: hypothetical protein LBH96_02420 [Candidatus Peribacteria bacterium]|jgi:hypothetical protein|nr:hypothetical protein [Candidatus Peribacteria bacterium]
MKQLSNVNNIDSFPIDFELDWTAIEENPNISEENKKGLKKLLEGHFGHVNEGDDENTKLHNENIATIEGKDMGKLFFLFLAAETPDLLDTCSPKASEEIENAITNLPPTPENQTEDSVNTTKKDFNEAWKNLDGYDFPEDNSDAP